MHVQKLYRIFSMRRGGQHVFIDWLLEQTHGAVLFLNDVNPEQNLVNRSMHPGEYDKFYIDGKPSLLKPERIDVLIVNYEDWLLSEGIIQAGSGNMLNADHVVNLLLLRDPLNLFSSRYFFWARMPLDAERWRWDDTALWKNHAEYYLSSLQTKSKLLPVNFDVWSSDVLDRKELSAKLGLQFSDNALQRISHVGSQFDAVHDADYSRRVASRWRYAAEIPQYQQLFDEPLTSLSEQIFNNNADLSSLSQCQATPVPNAEDIFSRFKAGEINQSQFDAIRLCHDAPLLNNWGLLAGIHAQQAHYDDVIACCRKMLRLDPANISTKYNLALALQEQSRFDEAASIYQGILSAVGTHPGVMINLANIYIKTDEFDKARELLGRLQHSGNESFELFNTLGLLAMEEEAFLSAIEHFNRAISINGDAIVSMLNLARCMAKTGEGGHAKDFLQKLIQTRELDDHTAQVGLAFVYRESGDYEQALQVLIAEQDRGRISLDMYMEIGQVYRELDRYDDAIQSYQAALSINHAFERTLNNIGAICMLQRDYEAAKQYFQQAVSLNSGYAEAHWNMSWVSLLQEDFQRGWSEYEWRFSMGVSQKLVCADIHEWKGQDIRDKRLLLYVEQGYGDAIQFVRYCQLLKESGASVIVLCDQVISGLLACADGVATVTSNTEIQADYYASLLSVPGILQLDRIPFCTSYIQPDYAQISGELIENLLDNASGRLRIGITWCGNPAFPDNRRRSCGLDQFALLAERSDVELYSLQKGEAVIDLSNNKELCNIVNMDSHINNFIDTAYIMSKMDLVITVDTSVAHLAGSIGCNTWVVLAYSADWRWHDDEQSRWYDSTQVFRQSAPGDWSELFNRIEQSLERITKN